MPEITPTIARGLCRVERVVLDAERDLFCHVRTLTARELLAFAKLGSANEMQVIPVLFRLLLCDAEGKRVFENGASLEDWPIWVMRSVVEVGMRHNRMLEDYEAVAKK